MKQIVLNNLIKYLKYFKSPLIYATLINIITIIDGCIRDLNMPSVWIACLFTYNTSFLLTIIHPLLLKIAGSFILLLHAIFIYLYYIANFQITPSNIWIFLMQTNIKEATAFISAPLIVVLIIAGILFWLLSKISVPVWIFHKSLSKKNIIVRVILIALLYNPTIYLYNTIFSVAKNYTSAASPYSSTFHLRHRIKGSLPYFLKDKTDLSSQLKSQLQPINIYFIMGESLRGDYLGINGFSKNTTPLLSKQKIINFGIAKSCGNMTYVSWRYTFANMNCSDDISKELQEVFPKYFTQAGYKTLLVSQDNEASIISVVNAVKFSSASSKYQENLYEALLSMDTTIDNNKLFILNSFGSHMPYTHPPENIPLQIFHPFLVNSNSSYSLINPNNHQQILNSYYNTILFFDWQVSHIIDNLEKSPKPVILLYISDHGEKMNEHGLGYGHGGETKENFMVPFFVYTNNAFKKAYPKQYSNLINNAKKYKDQMTQEVIWHSILDIGGFTNKPSSNTLDYSRSIFSNQLKPRIDKNWYRVSYQRN